MCVTPKRELKVVLQNFHEIAGFECREADSFPGAYLEENVRFSKDIISTNKIYSIFSRQTEAIVYISPPLRNTYSATSHYYHPVTTAI